MEIIRPTATLLVTLVLLWGCARREAPIRPDIERYPDALGDAFTQAESILSQTGQSSAAWLGLGRLYHANSFHEEAKYCYEQIAGDAVEGAKASYYLADLAEQASDLPRQLSRLQQTVQREPGYVPALLRLARAHYKSTDTARAVDVFHEVLHMEPNNAEALIGLAREALRQGNEAAARSYLDQATKSHPEFSSGAILLAQMLEKVGDRAGASELREQALKRNDPPPPDPWMDEVMEQCHDLQKLTMRFEDYSKAGMMTEARTYLRRMEAIDPRVWQAHWLRGQGLEAKNLLEEAAREYERGLAAGADPEKMYSLLVPVLVKLKRHAEAEEQARLGLKLAPRAPGLLVELAQLVHRNGGIEESTGLLEQAIAVVPNHVAANRALGQIHWANNDREKAVPALRIVEEADPKDPLVRSLLGQHYIENGEAAKAMPLLRQALAVTPKDDNLLELLAMACLRVGNRLAQSGQFAQAQASYDEAIGIRPQLIEAYVNKAKILLHLRDAAGAEQALQPLLLSRAKSPVVLLTLGDIQRALGRNDQARASWHQALKFLRFENNPQLTETLTRRLEESDER